VFHLRNRRVGRAEEILVAYILRMLFYDLSDLRTRIFSWHVKVSLAGTKGGAGGVLQQMLLSHPNFLAVL
jgi:hypothetical protein